MYKTDLILDKFVFDIATRSCSVDELLIDETPIEALISSFDRLLVSVDENSSEHLFLQANYDNLLSTLSSVLKNPMFNSIISSVSKSLIDKASREFFKNRVQSNDLFASALTVKSSVDNIKNKYIKDKDGN